MFASFCLILCLLYAQCKNKQKICCATIWKWLDQKIHLHSCSAKATRDGKKVHILNFLLNITSDVSFDLVTFRVSCINVFCLRLHSEYNKHNIRYKPKKKNLTLSTGKIFLMKILFWTHLTPEKNEIPKKFWNTPKDGIFEQISSSPSF